MIRLNKLEIGYKNRKQPISVFKDINAQFNTGDLVGLMGNNGIGKSTLLKTITGTLLPLSGEALLQSKNIHEYSVQQLAQQLSIVVTERLGGFNLTVWDVVASGRTPYINVFGKLLAEDETIIRESLDIMGLQALKHKLIDELSDGQRQKAMIAKSLAQQTPVIILDEPTAFLDHSSKHQLFDVLKKLCVEQKKLIIVSSHDLELMSQYMTRSVTLFEGNRMEVS
jgi:iron complex transport system ATP-binding protein